MVLFLFCPKNYLYFDQITRCVVERVPGNPAVLSIQMNGVDRNVRRTCCSLQGVHRDCGDCGSLFLLPLSFFLLILVCTWKGRELLTNLNSKLYTCRLNWVLSLLLTDCTDNLLQSVFREAEFCVFLTCPSSSSLMLK